MICWGCETLVRLLIAAADGTFAIAASARQRTAGSQSSRVLSEKRCAPLRNAGGSDRIFRHRVVHHACSVPVVEAGGRSRCCGHHSLSFPASLAPGYRCEHGLGTFLCIRPHRIAVAVDSRASCRLIPSQFLSIDCDRSRDHRIDPYLPRFARGCSNVSNR